ncbi:MAG TPA: glycosyl hydrolase family 28 protein [Kiritimatiellia bacterium]|nr:glycosyl hydrolase family 28 protein [Kiritimatiellia bacterium]
MTERGRERRTVVIIAGERRGVVVACLLACRLCAVTPNEMPGATDSDRIEAAITAALSSGENEVVIPQVNTRTGASVWLIDRAILLPSNLRLVLDHCLVRLAPGTQDNIMRNIGTESIPMVGNTNIMVTGIGNAVLSGGIAAHFDPPGDKSGWRTIGILLYNTRDFVLTGFTMEETQSWAISMENGCASGRVSNIVFSNTNKYPNQDGVDVRKGCHHIVIENISGVTGDDSVALTGLRASLDGSVVSRMQVGDAYPATSDDIHDIVIRNVRTFVAGGHHTVRLLNHDGIQLYNISISDVVDESKPGQTRPKAGLKIGDTGYWKLAQNQLGETYNVFVTNLRSRASSTVLIQGTLKDAILCNLDPFDGSVPLSVGTMPTQNVVVCNVAAPPLPPPGPTSVTLDGAVLEVDLAAASSDCLMLHGNLTVSADSRVEILTSEEVLSTSCRNRDYVVCRWSGEKQGRFLRTTNRSGWFAFEDTNTRSLFVAYRSPTTLMTVR